MKPSRSHAPPAPVTGWTVEARRVLALAWPVMLTSLNWTLMNLIDVAVVGRVSTAELAALAASRSVTFVAIVMGLSALVGVLVTTGRADGADNHPATGDALRSGLVYAMILGIGLGAAMYGLGPTALRVTGVAPALLDRSAAVVRAMAYAFPGQLVLVATGYYLEGISRPRRVMAVNLAMLPANALLAWPWSGGHAGLPMQGAVGAALATAAVSTLGAVALLVSTIAMADAARRGVRDRGAAAWRRAAADLPALVRFGAMPAFSAGLEIGGFAWLIVLSTRLGDVTASAFQAMVSLHNLAFATALGFGSAAGVRVGNAVGAGQAELARSRTFVAAGLATLTMGAIAALFFAFPAIMVAPLSPDDPAVVAQGAALLTVLSPFMLFEGVQLVMVYALRSLGDQVASGIGGIIAFFFVTGGAGWLLVATGHGATGLALASGIGMLVAAILQTGRFLWRIRPVGLSS